MELKNKYVSMKYKNGFEVSFEADEIVVFGDFVILKTKESLSTLAPDTLVWRNLRAINMDVIEEIVFERPSGQ